MLLVALSVTSSSRGQVGAGLDLAITSKHVWRGQTYRDGWVLQPALFVFKTWSATTLTGGAWLHLEPFAPDPANGVGYGRTVGGEVNAWLDLGGRAGPLSINAGLIGQYPRVDDAVGPASVRVRTHELYLRAVLARPRLTPVVALSYDIDAVEGAYAELGVQYRLPLWTQVLIPVGSVFFRASAAMAIAQSSSPGNENAARYFRDNGLTYISFSTWLPVGPFAFGAANSSVALAVQLQINLDPYLEAVSGVVDASRRAKLWVGLTWSLRAPRCRASRGVCPVGSFP